MHKNTFSNDLVRINDLDRLGFDKWIFNSGMLFDSKERWWGDGGNRKRPHEGLDLSLFQDKSGRIYELDSTTKIPVIYDGEVAEIENDILGQSVFVRHNINDADQNWLYTIYGHTKPLDNVCIGRILVAGEVFANIADASGNKTQAPPHLHISVIWIPESITQEGIDWKKISDNCAAVLLDPLKVIHCKYIIGNAVSEE